MQVRTTGQTVWRDLTKIWTGGFEWAGQYVAFFSSFYLLNSNSSPISVLYLYLSFTLSCFNPLCTANSDWLLCGLVVDWSACRGSIGASFEIRAQSILGDWIQFPQTIVTANLAPLMKLDSGMQFPEPPEGNVTPAAEYAIQY